MDGSGVNSILMCDTQPLVIEGVRALLGRSSEFRFAGGVTTLDAALELARILRPDVIIVDKTFGTLPIIQWFERRASVGIGSATVVHGVDISESEALRLFQAGARGVVRKSSEPELLLECIRSVLAGNSFLEQGIFAESEKQTARRHSALTPRELEVSHLVEQGLRNRDIARTLGIQTGTVKIHLKHIFEKTGVRGRYRLALNGLREKGTLTFTPCQW